MSDEVKEEEIIQEEVKQEEENVLTSFVDILQKGIVDFKKEVKTEREQVQKVLNKEFKKQVKKFLQKPISITLNEIELKKFEELVHNKFERVLKCVHSNIPVFLTGDAGSGKTTIAEQVAKSLNFNYYCISVCIQTSEIVFLGYKNADGNYVRTLFREAYENGGVFLIDEIDNGNPNVLSVLNSSLSNSVCAFPDKMVKKHKDFRLVATGNTIGRGADRKYVGRLEMDLATLDRFAVIKIDYDEKIENNIANKEIAKIVQRIRKKVFDKRIRLIVSPRASVNITKLITCGIKLEEALEICIFKSCEKTIKSQILENKQELFSGYEEPKKKVKKEPKKETKTDDKDCDDIPF